MSLAMETRRWQSVQSACCAGVPKREECEVVLRRVEHQAGILGGDTQALSFATAPPP